MTYNETLEYLFGRLPMFQRIGPAAYKANLDNTHAIMNLLDHPEKDFRCVHIAGTNGKGSVSNMLAAILQQCGYKTGLYTSPHLKDFRERIRIDGKMIEKSEVVRFVKKYRNHFETIEPSFFEWTVGLAFDYFSRKNVDIAVIETGLGGRLDSTNVVTPLVSVITNVQYDHMNLLGNSLEKIAIEKAGIIKPVIPAVIGQSQRETAGIFKAKARKTGSKIYFADKIFSALISPESLANPGALKVDVFKRNEPWIKDLVIEPGGSYQTKNVCTVLQTCTVLESCGFELNRKNIRKALGSVPKLTGFNGRWQVLGKNPLIIADTAHNADGIREVMSQVKNTPHKKLHMVIGMVNDKDITKMLKLLPANATYYFCSPDIPRGLPGNELKKEASKLGLKGKIYPSVYEAFEAARENAGFEDMIYTGGSTFVVAEIV